MIKAESTVREVSKETSEVYQFLSDLRNLKAHIPEGNIKDFKADADSCSFSMDMLGQASFRITERVPNKTIRLTGDASNPFPFQFWVQMNETDPGRTQIKLTLHAEVNMMMRLMLEPALKSGIEMLADRIVDSFNG
jgi:carbon monoxide dehydrogenase subunit G